MTWSWVFFLPYFGSFSMKNGQQLVEIVEQKKPIVPLRIEGEVFVVLNTHPPKSDQKMKQKKSLEVDCQLHPHLTHVFSLRSDGKSKSSLSFFAQLLSHTHKKSFIEVERYFLIPLDFFFYLSLSYLYFLPSVAHLSLPIG